MTTFRFSGYDDFALSNSPDWLGYFHGFRSSPSSVKAQKVKALFAGSGVDVWMPQLPAGPAQAIHLIESEVRAVLDENPKAKLAFVGSSLGGFYATIMAQRFSQARTVLLNPATQPDLSLKDQLGKQKVYFSDEEIEFIPSYLKELEAMRVEELTNPQRYFLIAARDDETLDSGDMLERFPGVHTLLIEGSDHAISDFDSWLPFLGLFLGRK